MTRLLAILEYDGTDFEGFQIQKRGRTVQGELESALREITGDPVRVVGAGRTDTGVHALGQGTHFDTRWTRPPETLLRALNAVLPNDIAVRSISPVAPNFSARFNARSREYRYSLLNQAYRSPLACRYAFHIAEPLDVDAMDTAAKCLLGRQDFGAFGTPPHGENSIREMVRAEVKRVGAVVHVELEANAFLYRMVRRIVGTLLWVGKGEMSIEEFRAVMAKERRAGQSVPPHGLCLVAVHYDL